MALILRQPQRMQLLPMPTIFVLKPRCRLTFGETIPNPASPLGGGEQVEQTPPLVAALWRARLPYAYALGKSQGNGPKLSVTTASRLTPRPLLHIPSARENPDKSLLWRFPSLVENRSTVSWVRDRTK